MIRAMAVLLLFGFAMSGPTYAATPTQRSGVISHMGPGFPDDYLAIPLHTKGELYRVCAVRCVTLRQNDFGPNQAVHPDRIADVSASTFEYICGCPASSGLVAGSWTRVADTPLPATDTAESDPNGILAAFLLVVGLCIALVLAVRWPVRRNP